MVSRISPLEKSAGKKHGEMLVGKMAGKKSRKIQFERMGRVIELSAQGLGAYEISHQLQIDPKTVYSDMELFRRMSEVFLRTESRVMHLFAKSNRALKAAWIKLAPMLVDPASNAKSVAALISAINAIIGTQARILGVDHVPPPAGGQVAETLIIQVQTGERRETIALTSTPEQEQAIELPDILTDSMGLENVKPPAARQAIPGQGVGENTDERS